MVAEKFVECFRGTGDLLLQRSFQNVSLIARQNKCYKCYNVFIYAIPLGMKEPASRIPEKLALIMGRVPELIAGLLNEEAERLWETGLIRSGESRDAAAQAAIHPQDSPRMAFESLIVRPRQQQRMSRFEDKPLQHITEWNAPEPRR